MLSGDNGILQRATDAKTNTDNAQIRERIQLAYLDALTKGNGKATKELLEHALNSEFESEKYTLAEDLSKVTINEKDYELDGIIITKDENVELKIGDYVNYNPSNSETTSITSNGTDNGYGNQTLNLADYSGGWRVLGAKNGKIELISEDPVISNFYLKGKIGYQNAEQELNKVSSIFGKGLHATGARSVNIADINNITGYNPNAEGIKNPSPEQISTGNKYGKDSLAEYGNEVTYLWDGTVKPAYTSTNGKNGNLTNSHKNSSYGNGFFWYEVNEWKKSAYTTTLGEITKLTSTHYIYYPETLTNSNNTSATTGIANNSVERQMLFGKYYWLASKSVSTDNKYALFFVRRVDDGEVTGQYLVRSYGQEYNNNISLGVRPVVSLEDDVQLEKDKNGIWQFK